MEPTADSGYTTGAPWLIAGSLRISPRLRSATHSVDPDPFQRVNRLSWRLAWLLALGAGLLLAVLALWRPTPHLRLDDLVGAWRVDTAALPERRGLSIADAAERAVWREAEVIVADGTITLRAGGVEWTSFVLEGSSGIDMLNVSGDGGLAWTLHLHDNSLTIFTHTRAGSVLLTRKQP